VSDLVLREVPDGGGKNFEVFDEAVQLVGCVVLLSPLARTHSRPWM
jgi:hypothetical protein